MAIGPTFEEVLAAAKAGAEWAVATLYRDLNPALLRYLRARQSADAEDVASEVWIAAARTLQTFEGDETGFRSWIFTIARRRLIDHGRQAARRRTDPADMGTFEGRAASDDTAAAGLVSLSTREAVERLVADLPPDQAEVVLLRVLADLDVADVARIMDRTPGSVRVLQHRALRRLARRYARTEEPVTP
jgi:RNA polymerase sigma-70 factor (ECF subfamily)